VIKSIQIKGFRGIREGSLDDLSPLTILVGPNGSGKSTVLEATLFASSKNPATELNKWHKRHDSRQPRWLVFDQGPLAEVTLITDQEESVKFQIRSDSGEVMFSSSNTPQIARPADLSVDLVDAALLNPQRPLHTLYTMAVESGRHKEAQEMVCAILPEARSIEILTEQDKPVLQVLFERGSVPVSLVGDGIQKALRIGLELLSRRAGTVLLEEPEVFLHPGAMKEAAKVIWTSVRRGIQVILTTHSLEFIDALLSSVSEPDVESFASTYRLQLEDGKLRSYRLSGAEASFARVQIEDDLR
jgi:AAA15 family ATPase/GTPase